MAFGKKKKVTEDGKLIKQKAYKFRVYPNQNQLKILPQLFGNVRFFYNQMINANKDYIDGKTDKQIKVSPAKMKESYDFLTIGDALNLCNAQIHVDNALKKCFSKETVGKRKKKIAIVESRKKENKDKKPIEYWDKQLEKAKNYGKPKFKSRRDEQSFTTNYVNGNIKLLPAAIKLPKIAEPILMAQHRCIMDNCNIKSVTLTKRREDYYEVSILVEYVTDVKLLPINENRAIGVDYSSPHFCVYSNGEKANSPHSYRKAEEELKKLQRSLAKKIARHGRRGTHNQEKLRDKISKLHLKVKHQRFDFIHKESKKIVDNYDIIGLEDINLQDLSRCLRLAKNTYDNGFGMFRSALIYKAFQQGKYVVKIDKFFPSTKTCNHCNTINDVTLSDRVFECKGCKKTIMRDDNASLNIKDEAIKELHRILSGDVSESCEKRNDFLINHLNLCTEALTQESLYLSKNK